MYYVLTKIIKDNEQKNQQMLHQSRLALIGEMIGMIAHQWRQPLNAISLTAGNLKFKCMMDDYNKEVFEEEVENNRVKDKQLIEQSRFAQMGEMISMIAHQWRQPLSAISATSMTIELNVAMDNMEKKAIGENARNISKYSQHLSSTIDDFRNFFKTDKKTSIFTYEKVVKSVLNIIGTSLEIKGIKIVLKLNSSDVFNTYENELKQVVLNILKNAEDILLDKEIENAKITIKSDANNLYIMDNADGIHDDIIANIFDPYFSTKLEKNGTGLGLYMSKIIVEDHCNGKISVFNDEDGAVFKISLPPT